MSQNHTIFIALGSNTGDKLASIQLALRFLSEKVLITKNACVYRTKPWGYTDQDFFLNTALVGTTELSPEELLHFIKEVEVRVGRQKRFTNGPREIDIDILFYEDLILEGPDLQIPHPRLHERDFVLKPLLDIKPNFVHPKLQVSLLALYKKIKPEDIHVL
ncbi:MAG: 2-amino-4-hydroxy-6-hydroxymethyldihydropteridine diphosphokinase [Patescibacteria group bacterium]